MSRGTSGTALSLQRRLMADSPNSIAVAISVLRAQRVRKPAPGGSADIDHSGLLPVLDTLRESGVGGLPGEKPRLAAYREYLETVDPDELSRDAALAYWLNLYNAGALWLAAEAQHEGKATVLRVRGGFQRPWAMTGDEELSLHAIEHGKLRRFKDPRIHAALVCGSASCPTLRLQPYTGTDLDAQLDEQMRSFLANGGAAVDREAQTLRLSRVFLWYGRDMTRPQRMPTFLPARKRTVARAISAWLSDEDRSWVCSTKPRVEYTTYDWGLACSIA